MENIYAALSAAEKLGLTSDRFAYNGNGIMGCKESGYSWEVRLYGRSPDMVIYEIKQYDPTGRVISKDLEQSPRNETQKDKICRVIKTIKNCDKNEEILLPKFRESIYGKMFYHIKK